MKAYEIVEMILPIDGEIPATAAATSPSEAQVQEISPASTQTGQLQNKQKGVGDHQTPLAITWLKAL